MTIQTSPDATEATLQIPRSMLKPLLADSNSIGDGSSPSKQIQGAGPRTIIGGILLSLSFVGGGLWYWRFRKGVAEGPLRHTTGRIAFFIGLAILVFSTGGRALADVREPGPFEGGLTSQAVFLVLGGSLLFIALALGGFFFFRSKRNNRNRVGMIFFLIACVASLGIVCRADLRRPRGPLSDLPLSLPSAAPASGQVRVVVISDGDHITLTVPAAKSTATK